MYLSSFHNIRAIVKHIVTAILMVINSVLGLASISVGLFVGLIIVDLFFPVHLGINI